MATGRNNVPPVPRSAGLPGNAGTGGVGRGRPPSLLKRLWPALAIATVSSGVLVALDHPATSGPLVSGASGSGAARSGASSNSASTVPAQASAGGAPRTAPTMQTVPAARGQSTGASAPTSGAQATTGDPGAACTGAVKDGPEEQTRFGIVQVEATISASGRICAVDAIQSPNDRGRSIRINQQAVPILDQRAIEAQGVNFQVVSGATVTTGGYKASLQAILDGG